MCMALHEPVKDHESQKTLEVAVKCRFQACCNEPAKWVPTWAHVVLSRTQQKPKLEPLGEIGRKLKLCGGSKSGPKGPAMFPVLSPYGAQLGPVARNANGSDLGLSCGMLGASLSQVGPSWVASWPKLTPSGAAVAAMLDQNGAFGRWWATLQNVQITTIPPLKLYQTDRSASSSHRFLNYHASAPSARADFCWSKSN